MRSHQGHSGNMYNKTIDMEDQNMLLLVEEGTETFHLQKSTYCRSFIVNRIIPCFLFS